MYVKKLDVSCKGYFKHDLNTHGERKEGHETKRKKRDAKWTKESRTINARVFSLGRVPSFLTVAFNFNLFLFVDDGAVRCGAARRRVASHLCPDRSIVSRIVPMKKQKHNLYRGKRRRKLDKDRATAFQRLGQKGICQSKRASLIDGNNIGIVLINYSSDIRPIRSIQLRRVHRYVSLTTTSHKAMLLNGD